MKKIVICFFAIFLLCYQAQSQDLILKGKVMCVVKDPKTTKGAENVVVFPNFNPAKASLTATRPLGYFEINTGVPLSKLVDKEVTMYAISRCKDCKEAITIFIKEDRDMQNKDDPNQYCTLDDWLLNGNCKKVEMKHVAADSVLRMAFKQPMQDLDKVSSLSTIVGSPTLLNFLTSVASVVAPTSVGAFRIRSLEIGKINYGQFLLASPLLNSSNTGFNFAPSRDMSEAIFWNPSAIALNGKSLNISLLANLKNNFKLSTYYRFTNKLALGGGIIYTKQDEFRNTYFNFEGDTAFKNRIPIKDVTMNLKEYAGFVGLAYKIHSNLSLGISIKSIWQDFNTPNTLTVFDSVTTFTDNSNKKQNFDFDISASYKVNNDFQIGLNLMNLGGTQFFGDAFVPTEPNKPIQKQRSLGLGLLYKFQRLHVGTDLLLAEHGLYDIAFGLNYVPFNNALLSAGIALKQLSYSLSFRIKYFRIAYINDNDFLINEKRKGKSAIFNGNIYGGVSIDLN